MNQIIQTTSPQIWQKIPPRFFIGKFTELDSNYTNAELVDNYALELIKNIITAHYDSNQKLLVQTQQLALQAFQKIKEDMVKRIHSSE